VPFSESPRLIGTLHSARIKGPKDDALLLAMLAITTAVGATSLAFIAIAEQHPPPTIVTRHLQQLQDELALP
jgi:hypothetical protein